MPHSPFRFVHASDLRLDQPPRGLENVPEHLRDELVDCPYSAAQRVVDCAITERADFLVLAGEVLDPWRTGPRGPLFLIEQFQRLRERGITVYWAGGPHDGPDQWPAGLHLPDNVHVFPDGRPATFVHEREGRTLCTLAGQSWDHGRRPNLNEYTDRSGTFTVGVAYVPEEFVPPGKSEIEYWALGGRPEPLTLPGTRRPARYCGSPQGRHPEDSGARGCSVVLVDGDGRARPDLRVTDAVRFITAQIELPSNATAETLRSTLEQRTRRLEEEAEGRHLLVTWYIWGPTRVMTALRRGTLEEELLTYLRREYGHGTPAIWTLNIEADLSHDLPEVWWEQETLLGEFLRKLRRQEEGQQAVIDLGGYLEERQHEPWAAELARVVDPAARRRVLRRVAEMGIDLLTAEGTK